MGCLVVLLASFAPRLVLALVWIFSNLVTRAFDGFLLPLLGLIVVPMTTLFYVLAFNPAPGVGVTGFGWLFVVIGFFIDMANYGNSARSARSSRAQA